MSNSNSNSFFNLSNLSNINIDKSFSSKISITRHLTIKSPDYHQNILNTYLNNNKISKSITNQKGKSLSISGLNLSSNNPSTFETSLSNSLFDIKTPQIKKINLNINNIPNTSRKILAHLRPKSDNNKIKLDIILGTSYFFSKQNNSNNKKKLEKFIFKTQKNFDKRMENFMEKNKLYKARNFIINNDEFIEMIKKEIKSKTKIFHKLENMMAIYSIIIYHLIKTNNKDQGKIIYLLIIKQNMNHIKYLEKMIRFKTVFNDKYGKYKLKIYLYGTLIILKIYSFLIKYGFIFNLLFYGNLFLKKYLSLSHKFYLYSLIIHKNKYSPIENIKHTKYWFSALNYYSAYFSISNYLPMKIPISLYITALNIYNSIDEQHYDDKDKYFILCAKYNICLLLYMNGQSDEAINNLKDLKINLFSYIEDNYYEPKKKYIKNNSFITPALTEKFPDSVKNKDNFRKKMVNSFSKIFNNIIQSKNLKSGLYKNRQISNINIKFEPFFISNTPINIENFVNMFSNICGISLSSNNKEIIKYQSGFGFKKQLSNLNNSFNRKSVLQLTQIENHNKINVPKIFQMPILLKSELLIAEIEIDKKHYRTAYTFTNHALAIIAIFRKVQNNVLLNKYNKEQKFIKEFLNIINNTSIKSDSEIDEDKDSEIDEENQDKNDNNFDWDKSKDKEFMKDIEYKERDNLTKKMLKELEKFFVFFMTLSVYQIKVLNETQPKVEIRNYLPILFQNQFKDSLSLRQNIALENLDVMSLSRYIILKDPNKLILPDNLNISREYLERPELLWSKFIKMEEKKRKSLNEKKENYYYYIFQQIYNSKNCSPKIQNLMDKAKNLVRKIIKKSDKKEIKEMIENPESLIKPLEKYLPVERKPFDRKTFLRQKSQVINHMFVKKKFERSVNNISIRRDKQNSFNYRHKSLKKTNIDIFINTEGKNKNKNHKNKIKNSSNKSSLFSRNKNNKNTNKEKLKNKVVDSYTSTYLLSLLDSNNSDFNM